MSRIQPPVLKAQCPEGERHINQQVELLKEVRTGTKYLSHECARTHSRQPTPPDVTGFL